MRSKLAYFRKKRHLTQEELSDRAGVSVRTIQRIEKGTSPKGYTLRALATALEVKPSELLGEAAFEKKDSFLKWVNLSSLLGLVFPPGNIILPFSLMWFGNYFTPLAKQLISLQFMYTLCAFIVFMLGAFAKNWFYLDNRFTLLLMISLILGNVFLILRNAAEIDRKENLYFQLPFNLI